MNDTTKVDSLGRITSNLPDFEKSLADPRARTTCCFGEKAKPLKIYILIRESIDLGHAVNCAAHASLKLYLDHRNHPVVNEWAHGSFRKVTCKVTDEEFERAKQFGNYVLITESKLEQSEVALAFLPKRDWEEFFKSLKLYA